ncbi:hypothetical protein ES703_106043 [subsurface metagenome]
MKLRERTTATLLIAIFMISIFTVSVTAKKVGTTIQDGVLTYATGTGYPNHYYGNQIITTGFDEFGLNYQSHMFVGYLANNYLGRSGLPPYGGDDAAYFQRMVTEGIVIDISQAQAMASANAYWPRRNEMLVMKWSDAWLSNKDRDGDGILDRNVGSDVWLTNHIRGTYPDGTNWYYFSKMVMPPIGSYKSGGFWYQLDGTIIGSVIWGSYARILQISNDPTVPEHGVYNNWASPTGFGYYK